MRQRTCSWKGDRISILWRSVTGRKIIRPICSKSSLWKMAQQTFSYQTFFSSPCELPFWPLKFQTTPPCLLSSRWTISLKYQICPPVSFLWHLHVYICNELANVLLLICLMPIWLIQWEEYTRIPHNNKCLTSLTPFVWVLNKNTLNVYFKWLN